MVLVLALFLGWTMGDGYGNIKEVGGLVGITLLDTCGVVLLIVAAVDVPGEPLPEK